MKKSVMLIVLLLALTSVTAQLSLTPPPGPFSSSSISSGSFSLTPPTGPFSNTPTANSPTQVCGNNVKEGTESCDGTDLGGAVCANGGTMSCVSCVLDSSACNPAPAAGTSGTTPPTQTPASTGGSTGGGGGGGGGGILRIELSAGPVLKSIPLGKAVQFTMNSRPYPLLLLLRKVDQTNQNSNWVLNGKFFDLNKSGGKQLDLNRDPAMEVQLEIVSFDRSAVMIKASVPGTVTPKPVTPTPIPTPAPRPIPVPEPVYIPEPVPVYEEINQEPFIVQPTPQSDWPVKKLAIGAGILLIILAIIYGIRRWKSVPHTITEYAKEGLKTGHSDDEIRRRLASAGWNKKEIGEAMDAAENKR